MNALRQAYPTITSIKKELTLIIAIVTFLIVTINFSIIFGNTHILHTSNKTLWTYDLFAILSWTANVLLWLATYWDIVEDTPHIHLMFFLTPIVLLMWGSVIIFNIKEIIASNLWHLCLISYMSSIVIVTLFVVFLVDEFKKSKDEEQSNYKLLDTSEQKTINKQRNQNTNTSEGTEYI